MNENEQHQLLFNQLVAMFHFAALQQMGKLKSPMSDKIERDLQQSKVSIDMLEMLHAKTKGNLDPDEERHLSELLRELRLNYVDEAAKDRPPAQAGSPSPPAAGEASPAGPAGGGASPAEPATADPAP